MTISEFMATTSETNAKSGFTQAFDPATIGLKLMLASGELSEALEEIRAGHSPKMTYFSEGGKPEGFGVELADAIIRILNLCADLDIDIEKLMVLKAEYNATRPFKHGKAF